MKMENEMFSDSFRALSPEKLGVSVLELCADEAYTKSEYKEYDPTKWTAGSEEE